MKFAAVVVMYHPTRDVLKNIQSFDSLVDKIFVFDNTEAGTAFASALQENPKIVYFHDHQNAGISYRLNKAAELAIAEGIDWLLMMDQDSHFSEGAFAIYKEGMMAYPQKERVAIFSTTPSRDNKVTTNDHSYEHRQLVITSGSFLNLHLFPTIGPFDEALFVDAVDSEYSLRVKTKGWDLIGLKNVYLQHELGTLVRKASLKTLYLVKKEKEIHSPLRCYYIYKNNLYLIDKYQSIADKATMDTLKRGLKLHLKRSFWYSDSPIEVLKNLLAARRDFKLKKMGKLGS